MKILDCLLCVKPVDECICSAEEQWKFYNEIMDEPVEITGLTITTGQEELIKTLANSAGISKISFIQEIIKENLHRNMGTYYHPLNPVLRKSLKERLKAKHEKK